MEGTARGTVDEEVRLVTENRSVSRALGVAHRREHTGKVQTGSDLREDDIIRCEDVYART